MPPANKLPNLRRRVERARNRSGVTCSASRHVHQMADCLLTAGGYPMLDEAPRYCAESLLWVLESLWKARAELAQVKAPKD